MRFGMRDAPLDVGGGGETIGGPLRITANTDGMMNFTFSTSLRDVVRFAADAEAHKTGDAELGFVPRSRSAVATSFNPFDIWMEGKYSSFRDDHANNDLDGHFGLFTIGADYVFNRSLLFGALVQFDSMRQRSGQQASEISGTGWMMGPYATVRLTEHLFWQARAAWGASNNEVSPFLTYTDKFETDRWLASSKLAGRWDFGPWLLKPSISVAYMKDVAKSYTDTFGVVIPEVTTQLGQAKAGPDIAYRYMLNPDVLIEPHAGVQLIWNFAGDTTASPLVRPGCAVVPKSAYARPRTGAWVSTCQGAMMVSAPRATKPSPARRWCGYR
jgi:outer membrane autotransporter protein